jgi:hypothetical protein
MEKNRVSQNWDFFNAYFLSSDIFRLKKFLVKHNLFQKVLNVPGNIVELGVFKGVGLCQLLKLREIYTPGSEKMVIGFDYFDNVNLSDQLYYDSVEMEKFYRDRGVDPKKGISKESLSKIYNNIGFSYYNSNEGGKPYKLIEGDILKTLPVFLEQNKGFRISFLLFDMDMYKPTLDSLNLLYDRVTRGGVIIFDEYGCDEWGESNAVDEWLKEHPEITLMTDYYSGSPTAYFIKK